MPELQHRYPWVDAFVKPSDVAAVIDLAREHRPGLQPSLAETQAAHSQQPTSSAQPPVSVGVPISYGCDPLCTYCIVRLRRGAEVSRPVDEIVAEVEDLAQRGVKEITLLGQNVDSYGHDLPEKPDLAKLLTGLNRVDGLARIRFLTSHPKDMSERLIEAMARLEKVCEHVSLPLQAGDDEILRAMGRGYNAQKYRDVVSRIRQAIPHIALSTDVIVGFPGESEEQFQKTYDLLSELRFDTVHVACYSPRPGTIASRKLEDDVPAEEKVRRRERIEELQQGIATEINARLLGSTVEVLVQNRKNEKWWGRTRTDKLVFFVDDADRLGQLVKIRIEKTSPWSLQGSLAR